MIFSQARQSVWKASILREGRWVFPSPKIYSWWCCTWKTRSIVTGRRCSFTWFSARRYWGGTNSTWFVSVSAERSLSMSRSTSPKSLLRLSSITCSTSTTKTKLCYIVRRLTTTSIACWLSSTNQHRRPWWRGRRCNLWRFYSPWGKPSVCSTCSLFDSSGKKRNRGQVYSGILSIFSRRWTFIWRLTSTTLYSACELEIWEYRWKQTSSCSWRCIFVGSMWRVDNLSAFVKWFPFSMPENCSIGQDTVSWLSASFRSCTIGCKSHIISASPLWKWTNWLNWLIAKSW